MVESPEIDTRQRILDAALDEFCTHGRSGASTVRIVRAAGFNIRMLYHYFGSKDGLYLAALLQVYADLREAERREEFWKLPPREALIGLARFTFDYMQNNLRFPKMILAETLAGGRTVQALNQLFAGSRDLMDRIDAMLEAGHASGVFGRKPSALDLYLTVLALSFIHISNRRTLSITFGLDLGSPDVIASRRAESTNAALSYVGTATIPEAVARQSG